MSDVMPSFAKVVQFKAPRCVEIGRVQLAGPSAEEVTVKTMYTAVSTGTEMLLYRGEMPSTISADATIPTLAAPFSYPCTYGYCNVGTVVRVGSNVQSLSVGDTVFAFREHTSAYTDNHHNVKKVPNGISPRDACFMPIVETALSILMDAAVIPGEALCIVGQGAVGLFVAACSKILCPMSPVLTVEPQERRRRLSVDAAQADCSLDPRASGFMKDAFGCFDDSAGADVSIDVSGTGNGLDCAIQLTRDGGKVVVASWFGNKTISLSSLGGRFHRSHMTLVASQVSHIPSPLRARWTKERRFALAWKLLQCITPCSRFPVTVASVTSAPVLYDQLDRGDCLQILFEYDGLTDSASGKDTL